MRHLEREMRGIPYFLIREYLLEMGGEDTSDGQIVGHGWRATLTKMEPYRLFSITVGQNRLVLDLEDEIADAWLHRFEMKTMRAGA